MQLHFNNFVQILLLTNKVLLNSVLLLKYKHYKSVARHGARSQRGCCEKAKWTMFPLASLFINITFLDQEEHICHTVDTADPVQFKIKTCSQSYLTIVCTILALVILIGSIDASRNELFHFWLVDNILEDIYCII